MAKKTRRFVTKFKFTFFVLIFIFLNLLLYSSVNDTASITLSVYSDDPTPDFYFIFSKNPLTDNNGNLLNKISKNELNGFISSKNRELLVIKAGKKRSFNASYFTYNFGPGDDENMPWNNGIDFNWNDRKNYSDEIWDNITVIYNPSNEFLNSNNPKKMIIKNIIIKRRGLILFDSTQKESHTNKYPVKIIIPEINLFPQNDNYQIINLSRLMKDFKKQFFELTDEILISAYSDLAQIDPAKYTNTGKAWCSDFASYNYRINGIMTPDPFDDDVYSGNLNEFFQNNGRVYTLREAAQWDNNKKKNLIKQASIVCRDGHTFIFNSWYLKDEKINKFSSVSGNNSSGGIRYHALIELPDLKSFEGKTKEELEKYDKENFIGVYIKSKENTPYTIGGTINLTNGIIAEEDINLFINAIGSNHKTYSTKVLIKKGETKTFFSIMVPAGEYFLNIWNYEKNLFVHNNYLPEVDLHSTKKYDNLFVINNKNINDINLYLDKELREIKIKNKLTSKYLYEDDNKIKTCNGNGEGFIWIVENASGNFKRIKNKKTGNYIHIEHLFDYLECDNTITTGWWSAMWIFINNHDGTYLIQNRWKPNNKIHTYNNKVYTEHMNPDNNSQAAVWILEEQ